MCVDNLVFDLGFHNGDDTDFYLAKGFSVVAVEANPNLVKQGAARFEQYINDGRLTLLNMAVSDSSGEMDFYIHPHKKEWSSCFQELAESDGSQAKIVRVRSVSLIDLIGQFGVPGYMKVDIEGCDLLVAKQLSHLTEKPTYVSFETSRRDYAGLFAYLYVSGYVAFQLRNQANNNGKLVSIDVGDGKSIDYELGPFSSGLFGVDLPENGWLTYDDALVRYIKYKELKQIDNRELGLGWLDLHAHHSARSYGRQG